MYNSNLKTYLKRIPIIYYINSRYKASLTRRALTKLKMVYAKKAHDMKVVYSEKTVRKNIIQNIKERGITIATLAKGNLRIFWVGVNWDQDNSGFLDTLKKFGEVVSFKNSNGGYGLLLYENGSRETELISRSVIEKNDSCLLDQVQDALKNGQINVLIGQMWATHISPDALRNVQQMGIVTINIAMDDRLPVHWKTYRDVQLGSIGLSRGLDLVLTTSPECCLRYAVEGCPAIYWPLASDPERFKPYPEDEKIYDVCFIGNKYGIRGKIVKSLLNSGIRVEAFGSGWPNGTANADQSAEIFGRSRIILGVGNIAYNDDIFTLKLRDFDATMAGALYITHRNSDLLKLFDEGKEIECYLSIDECIRKIRFYLDHPVERMAIAKAAAERARREHTWDHRLNEVFTMLGMMTETNEMK